MVDDLTTLGVDEPYRMFTSRAEFRLTLREDNAADRLTPVGRALGVVTDAQWAKFSERTEKVSALTQWCEQTRVNPRQENNLWLTKLGSAKLSDSATISQLTRRPELKLAQLIEQFANADIAQNCPAEIVELVETNIKFSGYLVRQDEEIERLRKGEETLIPGDFCYDTIPSLRIEAREKLKRHRPASLGQARRIPGITPSTINVLSVFLHKTSHSPQN
jgi:tRNA uridine 5-carboxymethylaminomethyl modification enzyme